MGEWLRILFKSKMSKKALQGLIAKKKKKKISTSASSCGGIYDRTDFHFLEFQNASYFHKFNLVQLNV